MKTRILLYGLFLNCYLLHGQPNNNPSTIEYLGSNDLPPAFWSVIDSEQEVNNQPERPVDRTVTYLETFDDPLSDWVDGWLYQNTNLQNFYYSAGTCDHDNRGNQIYGIWISDDKDCGSIVYESPVDIYFSGGFGDNARSFSIDIFT